MKRLAYLFVLLTLTLPYIAVPARAEVVITQLSHGALLGHSVSASVLIARVRNNRARVALAARRLGLDARETAELMRAVDENKLQWVRIPRRLDGMAWLRRNQVLVLNDVVIPADTHGWETDIQLPYGKIRAFLPQECGNLSIIRTNEVLGTSIVVPRPKPVPPLAARMQSPEFAAPPAPPVAAAFTPAFPSITSPPVVVATHVALPWLLLLPIALIVFHGGGSHNSPPGPPAPTPTPPVFICFEGPLPYCGRASSVHVRIP